MSELSLLQKQRYQRMIELSKIARQHYLDEGGDRRRSSGTLHGNDSMTAEERREFVALGRQVFGVRIVGGKVYCQGQSWKLPVKDANNVVESQSNNLKHRG